MKTILFLHGFFAAGQCMPAAVLRSHFEGRCRVLSPDLSVHPNDNLRMLRALCDTERPALIIGNSCGSFYGQIIANEKGIPALLGNPHLAMSEFLIPRLGPQQFKAPRADGKQDFVIDEALVAEFAALQKVQFDHLNPAMQDRIWGLFGENDAIAHYEPLFREHYGRIFHFPGGHTPTEDELKAYYIPLAEQMLDAFASKADNTGESLPNAIFDATSFAVNNVPSIVLYSSEDGELQLDVKLENDTVWLTQSQMAMLFDTTPQNITMHIRGVYKDKELAASSTCKESLQVQAEGSRRVTRKAKFYNLDMIISVGYRVKSRRGVQFRIWANKVLKEYLVRGYAINQKITQQHYDELKDVVQLMARTYRLQEDPSKEDAEGLLQTIGDYVQALDLLDHYDYQQLTVEKTTKAEPFHATYDNAMLAIGMLKSKFGGSALFANEKDESFRSSIGQIYQTFDGAELYPSVEEKAAMLLYLVVKNHSFTDGNKRIAAMLFLWFMDKNGILYSQDGHKRIGDNTLVAITLMIAESRPEEKDIMVKMVVNLINRNNQ